MRTLVFTAVLLTTSSAPVENRAHVHSTLFRFLSPFWWRGEEAWIGLGFFAGLATVLFHFRHWGVLGLFFLCLLAS